MASRTSNEVLDPSELGTKIYWDRVYDRELKNHGDDEDDEGTVWFSESNSEEVVIKLLDKIAGNGLLRQVDENSLKASRFLDLGTGNGHMLFQLRMSDDDDLVPWDGEMVGVDYSEASVQLARQIATQRLGSNTAALRFELWDLLEQPPGDWLDQGFDVVLDKGTFDAISLMNGREAASHPCETYLHKVTPLVRPGHFLVITSCNWTKDELLKWLSPPDSELELFDEAKYPTFKFGGQTGQSVVTLVFQRRSI